MSAGHKTDGPMYYTYVFTQTFTLTQGEDFDFNFAENRDTFDGPNLTRPLTLTFKVVSA